MLHGVATFSISALDGVDIHPSIIWNRFSFSGSLGAHGAGCLELIPADIRQRRVSRQFSLLMTTTTREMVV